MQDEFEDDYYVADDSARQGWRGRFTERMSTWIGAALALVVIGAMVLWGYRLGQREASAVPVIRAALEQAKIQPDDSGGAEIAHQDITSYDAGDAAPAPARITFAPPPERPAEEDVAMGALQNGDQETAEEADADPGEADDVAAADDAGAGPDATADEGTEQAPEASPVAPRRPGDLSQRMETARQAVSEEAELASRAKASPVQIQLGAYSGKELTRTEWARIYRENEDILAGRALVVQSTISGGRRFFRLRAGPFKDQIEARNICRALQSRGQECLVVVNG
ncbi:MAG: SPOR domain-containing protein [Alphaproteobacteria bacterium]